jgi:cephalosporin hydroxylase
MKIVIDTTRHTLTRQQDGAESAAEVMGLFSKEAFEILSREWVRVGWSLQYYHTFTWFGLPILQLPEDLVRLQEVIYALRPALIVETGVCHGGSLLFHASLLEAMGLPGARVIGIDSSIPPAVRQAIAQHPLRSRITLIEGDSTAPGVVQQVAAQVPPSAGPDSAVLVILDSDHSRNHVAEELECYAPLITKGSYIIATDGVMKDLPDVPRAEPDWGSNNPFEAARAFAARHPEFAHAPPPWLSQAGPLTENVTYWPGAWLRRT